MANAKKAAPKAAPEKLTAKQKALKEAQAKFEEAQARLNEKKQAVTKAKRTIATGDKKIATLDKKIEEETQKPDRAVEILLKRAEEMEKKAAELEAEQEEILKQAEEIEEAVEEKTEELEKAKEEAAEKMKELGITTKMTASRSPASGTAAQRRAKNNFQYRLRDKKWNILQNEKRRIMGAEGFGLSIDFQDQEFVVSKDGEEVLKHPYGIGSLIQLAECVKEHGVDAEDYK